jgi:hypothetical protein
MLGIAVWCWVGSTFEADITAHFIQVERPVTQVEIPQPDGMTKKVVSEIFIDRIFRAAVSNEIILATNTVDSGRAVIKLVPADPRRQ